MSKFNYNAKREIHGFKLLQDGDAGIEIDSVEYMDINGARIVDRVKRVRKLMPSDSLRKRIDELKYYFFNLTGHWIKPYQSYFIPESNSLKAINPDSPESHLAIKKLWNKTVITGAVWKEEFSGFVLKGKIETVNDRWMGLSTPYVTAEDDFGFFEDCLLVLQKIANELNGFINKASFAIEEEIKKMPKELIEGMNADEQAKYTLDYLQSRGAIIMMDESSLSIAEPQDAPEIKSTENEIDSQHQEEAEEITDEMQVSEEGTDEDSVETEEYEDIPHVPHERTEDPNPYGPPAADIPADLTSEVPKEKDGDDPSAAGMELEAFEHSENLSNAQASDIEEDDEW